MWTFPENFENTLILETIRDYVTIANTHPLLGTTGPAQKKIAICRNKLEKIKEILSSLCRVRNAMAPKILELCHFLTR